MTLLIEVEIIIRVLRFFGISGLLCSPAVP